MTLTDINSKDRPVQQTFAGHLVKVLGWECLRIQRGDLRAGGYAGGRVGERRRARAASAQDFASDRAIEDGPTARDLLLPHLISGECMV